MKKLFLVLQAAILVTILIIFVTGHTDINEPAVDNFSPARKEWKLFKTSLLNNDNPDTEKQYIKKSPEELYREATGLDKINLTQEDIIQKWNQVLTYPVDDNDADAPYDTWTTLGPYAMTWTSTYKYNGRVGDLEFEGLPSLRVGSASGGLWKYIVLGIITIPIPISDAVTSLNIGAVCTNTLDTNTTFLGTGEIPTGLSGTGLWKTSNGGAAWNPVTLPISPGGFYRIKYRPGSSSVIHAVCEQGYLRSDAGGNSGSWTLRYSGNISDIAINNSNPDVIYITKYGVGLFKSIDGGNTFNAVSTIPVTAADWGRASIGIANSDPNYVYVVIAKPGANSIAGVTKGIFKTTNAGSSWQDVSWRDGGGNVIDFHWNQGNYGNCIGVCPTNRDIVLTGGGSVLRTSNGGTNWFESSSSFMVGLHVDQHVIKWHSDGQRVYIGNDGGVNYSNDQGITWNTSANILPTAQFYGFSSAVSGGNIVLAGGLQDNSTALSTNSGSTWNLHNGGDGWDAVINKYSPAQIFTHNNNFFSKTLNGGINWIGAGTGLNTAQWVSNFEDDGSAAVSSYIYAGNDNKVLYSTDMGSNFTQFSAATLNTPVWRITSTSFSTGATILYAVQWNNGSPNQNDILRVWDGGAWQNRGAGLPLTPLRFVCSHPRSSQKAYALTEWYGSAQKVFKTTNRGVNWQNVTGDLPNIPMTDLVPHPTNDNILYLATDYGMWKTSNGGSNWSRWTNGMPIANKITELEYIDSVSAAKFYIIASSHGRSIWIRDASANDPVSVNNNNETLPVRFELMQNFPNPFNPSTTIKFSIPVEDNVEIKIFDLLGREVGIILNGKMSTGTHEITFDGKNLSSGIYFYTMRTSRFSDTKKMVLVK